MTKKFPEDRLARLQELADLKPGWLDGEGEAISTEALRKTAALIADLVEVDAPIPRIYATSKGEVQLEWHGSGMSTSVTLNEFTGFEISVFCSQGVEAAQALSRLLNRSK